MRNFEQKSYQQHSRHFKDYAEGGEKEAHARTWFQTDTVDAWRHQRMYAALDPLLGSDSGARWLTVGDGRFGKDANYIEEKGGSVLATDISDTLLQEAKLSGFISDYRLENAESLSFDDGDFDYVFCKESYHHFPRPMVALYEMLRVSRKGVVLLEPNDSYINSGLVHALFRKLKNVIRFLLKRNVEKHSFEVSGNYVFTISRREIEKVALGLDYRTVAFKGIFDAYCPGVEYEKLSDNGPLQRKLKKTFRNLELRRKLGLLDYNILAAVIFKQTPSPDLVARMLEGGYEVIHLPENPHISDE